MPGPEKDLNDITPALLAPRMSRVWVEGEAFVYGHRPDHMLWKDKFLEAGTALGLVVHIQHIALSDERWATPKRRAPGTDPGRVPLSAVHGYICSNPGCTIRDLVDHVYYRSNPHSVTMDRVLTMRARTAMYKLKEKYRVRTVYNDLNVMHLYPETVEPPPTMHRHWARS